MTGETGLKTGESELGEELYSWLTYAASDERKLLIILALKSAGEPLGRSMLNNQLSALAGERLDGQSSAVKGTVDRNLVRLGLADVRQIEIDDTRFGATGTVLTDGYKLTQKGEELGVAFAGQLLGWSLDNENLALAQIFGVPNSKGNEQSAYLRYAVLQYMVQHSGQPTDPSMLDFPVEKNIKRKAIVQTIERLVQYGVLSKNEITNKQDKNPGTDYHLAAGISEPVTELLLIIDNFQRLDPLTIEQGIVLADEIIRSNEKFLNLYNKARRGSNFAIQDKEQDARNLGIIEKLGKRATARSVYKEYIKLTGREVTLSVIQESLARLVQDELVRVQMLPSNARNKTATGYYSPIEKYSHKIQ